MRREIIRIDEEKCDGCGECVTACEEGAIRIIDGKARLVKDAFCDGLGACIGECPQGALTIEVREAHDFDAEAVRQHLARLVSEQARSQARVTSTAAAGCPGSRAIDIRPRGAQPHGRDIGGPASSPSSTLGNWPVQIRLVPVTAPYLRGARLLIAADCVPFAYADFHRRFLDGRVLLIGCPKLDDADFYRQKLAELFRQNDIRDVQVGFMEVPCCFGLVMLVRRALEESGRKFPLTLTRFGVRGEICDNATLQ